MKVPVSRLFLLPAFVCLSSFTGPGGELNYRLNQPDITIELPPVLHEISGLTTLDSVSLACIQDEMGVIYIYNTRERKVMREIPFAVPGDYEGITRVGGDMYVLRSDGAIAEIIDFDKQQQIVYHETGIPAKNNEGLCYDEARSRLLIGCKSKPEGAANKDNRLIYAFDLKTKKLLPSPVYSFSINELIAYAATHHVTLPVKSRKKGKTLISEPFLKLATSEIAIHPVTGELFLLSAADKLLIVFDAQGAVKHMKNLDPYLFNKAEGVTFFNNGDMMITNEGQERRPTLHRFNYKKNG